MNEDATSTSCIGMLELASVAAGLEATDGLLKVAPVRSLLARHVSPGKFLTLFAGEVSDVQSALRRGKEIAGDVLVDELLIPSVAPGLLEVVEGRSRGLGPGDDPLDAVGIVETLTVASSILAADVAAKTASVELVSMRLANQLGGKSYFVLTGEVSDVRSAVLAAGRTAEGRGLLARQVVIARPHPDLGGALV